MTRRATLVAALVTAAVGAAGVAMTALADPRRALLGWLAAYAFGLGTALGALILAMVFHVTAARWPVVLRPYVMAIAGVTPLFVLLFVPIALGLRLAYPWVHLPAEAGNAANELASAHQRQWHAPSFVLGRAAFYLACWSILSIALTRARGGRQHTVSAAGLPILALTMTFASFDWLMSVEPGWVSDMYGLYFFAGALSSSVSLVAIVAWLATRGLAPERAPRADHFHAVGRLMLMATVFWAYIAFFQLLLVWIANLPREVGFYATRAHRGYEVIDGVLLVGHFVVPFLLLLSRPLKRQRGVLAGVAAWLVIMNAVDVAWLVLPASGSGPRVLDVAPFLLVSGLAVAWGALRFRATQASTEASITAPLLAESLEYRSP